MTDCAWCKHSISSLLDGKPQLVCLFWRRKASQPCSEYEREPGADDDKDSQPDSVSQTEPDHFHQSPKEGER